VATGVKVVKGPRGREGRGREGAWVRRVVRRRIAPARRRRAAPVAMRGSGERGRGVAGLL